MIDFITLIVKHMHTVDNQKDSAKHVTEHITKLKLKIAKEENLGKSLTSTMKKRKGVLQEDEQLALLKTIVMKYKIMRIRSKLSFMAFKANLTIQELIIKQILQSNQDMVS